MVALGSFDPGNALQVLIAGVEALHGNRRMRVEGRSAREDARDRRELGQRRWLRQCRVPKSRGMRSRETHAADAGNLTDSGQQFREGPLPFRILVGIYILAEQLNFGVTEIGHLAGFREDRSGGAAAFLAARKGNHAVGAELVAALNDRDVSAVRIGAGGEFGFEAWHRSRGRRVL